ncbi:MAG TPA: MMPL family transporter [Candidatus Limnocylindrales bacterium]
MRMGTWVRFCRRYRWLVLGVWLLTAAAGAVAGSQIFDSAAVVDELSPRAESMRAQARLDALKPEAPTILAITKGRHPYDPELVASVEEVTRALEPIAKVESLYNAPGGGIGKDNLSTMVRVEVTDPSKQDEIVAALRRIQAPQVLVGGETLAEREFADRAISGAALGESVGLAVLAVLLILILGWRSAWLPLVSAFLTIAVTLLALRGLAEVITVSEFAVNVVTLVGLGLSVDYALLILWRQRQDGHTDRACRTVLISGGLVGIALLGLMLLAEPLLASMALGGLVAVVVATAAGLTLVPALLPENPSPIRETTLVGRMASFAVARPRSVAALSAGALLLLSLPFLGVSLHNSDARALPRDSESRLVFEENLHTFRQRPEPVTVIVEADAGGERMRDYLNLLNGLDGVARLEQRLEIPAGTTVIDLTPDSESVAPAVVRAVRALAAPAPILVGGAAAEIVDYRDAVAGRLPLMLAVVFAAMLVMLFLLTGSLLIPVKALLLNLLSLGAALGVLSIIFNDLDLTTPVLLFVFIFGLSMDYEVFALSRIFEGYRDSRDNTAAIVDGLARTGPVLTAAALSLIVVFLGFLLGGLAPMTHLGIGMVLALVIDVTIVRALLLPATMQLLGRWNYWPEFGGVRVKGPTLPSR